MLSDLPKIPIGEWIEAGIEYLVREGGGATESISEALEVIIEGLQDALMLPPPELFIVVIVGLTWWLAGRKMAVFSAVGLFWLLNARLWEPTMSTLSMVLSAVFLCVIIGVPLGILGAKKDGVRNVLMPILDFMQTLPAFVYLLPAIFFFGLGVVPAVIATIIFAMPPIIRLTILGMQQVPEELVELGNSFGSTFFQMLFKIELPLAMPTIMAGVNQCIMLSLSMVVIAAMIGAKGLGGEVWRSIQRLEIGVGFEAGLAIVVVAVILDRITQNMGKADWKGDK